MATTVTVARVLPVGGGVQWVEYEYTFDGGYVLRARGRRVPAGQDLQAFGNSLIPRIEASVKNRELEESDQAEGATSPNSGQTTNAERRERVVKGILNRMVTGESRIPRDRNRLNDFANPAAAALVGWTAPQIQDAKDKLQALANATLNLDHGYGEIP